MWREELYEQYVEALRRLSAAQERWESVRIPPAPLQPGQEPPRLSREQIDAERGLAEAWDAYVEKRDAYYRAGD
jgi:hypothetical protein